MKVGKALIGLILLVIPLTSMAQWSTSSDVNNAICNATGDQTLPLIVTDGSGGAIIAWQDQRSGNFDIYAQRIDANGIVRWLSDGVLISSAPGDQLNPTMVSDGAGGAILTWEDVACPLCENPDYNIYAQRIDSGGVVQWTTDGKAICTAEATQEIPTIASDGAGGAIITWSDGRGSTWDIYAQRVSHDGTILWIDNGAPICTASDAQGTPTIASDGAGGAIITWIDGRGGLLFDIYAQHVNASGLVQWTTNGVPICQAADAQLCPTIASDDSGGAIIAWQDLRHLVFNDIYAQRIDVTGAVRWHGNGVEICTAGGGQTYPYIISDGSGGGIITWKDGREVTQMDIYAQRVDPSGTVRWHDNGARICTASDDQTQPSLAPDGAGGAIIAWRDQRGTHSDIYAQRIDSSGTVQWTIDGVPVSTAGDGQIQPAVVSAGAGRTIIAFEDHRNGAPDIYAQLVDRNGLLAQQDPAYDVSYRSASYTEWSHALDSKGAPKAEKRKNYRGYAEFSINPGDADADSSQGVYLEFGSGLYALTMSEGGTMPAITPDAKVKKLIYTFDALIAKTHAPINVAVWAKITKPLVLKKYWWVPKGTATPATYRDLTPPAIPTVTSQLWLRMPNLNNVGEEVFGMTGLPSQFPTGLLIGVPQGISQANAVNHPKYKDVIKSLFKKIAHGCLYHCTALKGLCTFDGTRPKPISKLQKSLPPNKQDNLLFADLLTLKLNIAASDLGAFHANFGDLIYGEYLSEYEGQSVATIAARADAMISSCVAHPTADQLARLQTVLERINSAFSGTFDTMSFGARTVLTSVRRLGDVWYLLPPPAGAPPRIQPTAFQNNPVPMQYALEQNYPNPFNPTTTIEFTLLHPSIVSLKVYNALGQEVVTLINNEQMDEGDQEIEFGASRLASGVYFYRLVATPKVSAVGEQKPFVSVKKMMLVK